MNFSSDMFCRNKYFLKILNVNYCFCDTLPGYEACTEQVLTAPSDLVINGDVSRYTGKALKEKATSHHHVLDNL